MTKNNQKTLLFITILGLLVIAIYIFFSIHHQKHHEIEHEFPIANPWRQDVTIAREYVAQIRSYQHIELRSLERGYLQKVYVDEGQLVKEGQKMFKIMPVIAEAEYNKSKAEFQTAKIEYENTLLLNKKSVVSDNELALAKANIEKARAEMELAKVHLDFTEVKAPFTGIMDRFNVRIGSLVEEGELLTTLSDNSKIWVYFNVTESDYLNFVRNNDDKKKKIVKLILANGDIYEYDGIIDTIEADFNNEVGNIAFRASFDNPKNLLRHGETGSILMEEYLKDALLVPQKSTFEILDKKFVYLVDGQNVIHSKQIEIVDEIDHFFIVKSGLKETDKILLEGFGKVSSNMQIKTFLQKKEDIIASLNLPVSAKDEHFEDDSHDEDDSHEIKEDHHKKDHNERHH